MNRDRYVTFQGKGALGIAQCRGAGIDRLSGPALGTTKAREPVCLAGCLQRYAPALDPAAVTRHGTRHWIHAGAVLGFCRGAVPAAAMARGTRWNAGAPGSGCNGRSSPRAVAGRDRAHAGGFGCARDLSGAARAVATVSCPQSLAGIGDLPCASRVAPVTVRRFVTKRENRY